MNAIVKTGLIGASVSRSLSPALHEAEARALGLNYRYELFDLDDQPVGVAALPAILDHLQANGFAGCNVTFPVKQRIIPLLDSLSPEAEAMGAVNTVRFTSDGQRQGHNTDWWGFGENLRRSIPDARMAHVALIGAGGAGAAAAYALTLLGAGRITVIDRDKNRAREVADRLGGGGTAIAWRDLSQAQAVLADAQGMVQATPVGMSNLPGMSIDAAFLRPDLWVAEIVYVPIETELLRAARRIGCRTVDGGGMVVLQAARALEIFTGVSANPDRMREHLLTLLNARAHSEELA